MSRFKRINYLVIALSLILMIELGHCPIIGETEKAIDKEKDYYKEQLDNYVSSMTYSEYLTQHENSDRPDMNYLIEASSYTNSSEGTVEVLNDFSGDSGESILISEEGFVQWEVMIDKAGLYNLSAQYYPVEGKSSAIQRTILIDDELPFAEASVIEFNRFWVNEDDEIRSDNQGNQIRPRQIEERFWHEEAFKDQRGFYRDNLEFYFSEGRHTITLVAQREPLVLKALKIFNAPSKLNYNEQLSVWETMGYENGEGKVITIEAEQAKIKSSPMLYPVADNSGPQVFPYSPSAIRINSIGGYNWRTAGQWIEWEIDVPEEGLYEIGMNVKQNFVKGTFVSRKLYINGEVPFEEAEAIRIHYGNRWRQELVGGDQPYKFYLNKGSNTVRIEAVLGDFAQYIREIEESVRALNEIYRQVIMVTSVEPDQFRDYQLERKMPGLGKALEVERDRLQTIAFELRETTGGGSEREAVLIAISSQLDEFAKDVEKMTFRLSDFKTNIGALGTWMLQMVEQPMQLDALYVISPGESMPKTNGSWLDRVIHSVKTLFYSFFIDYNTIGDVAEDKQNKNITVWVGTGRDQANTMKALIDETFTKETGIGVNLMLVDMGTLLQATLSGQGPDVAMQVGNDLPMNYALRGAVADLTQFDDFEQVKTRFYPSALVPFEFNDQCFALPETQTFNMLFYRKDIFRELGLDVPETWNEVKVILSALSKNNMQFGMMPQPPQGVGTQATDLTYGIFLYQMGGEFYTNDLKKSALDSDIAINAFKEWTKFYTDYTLDREFDFVNRFRTGEMPIGIADYGVYNTLQVSAPEIKGLWSFTAIPGTPKEDGTIDKSVPSSGSSTIILDNSKEKDAAWEYLKWWTSEEVQAKFGREMEGLMGAAARYPTANINALKELPWPVEDYNSISEQFENVRGVPQIPGGYYTSRNIYNAFTVVVVDKKIGPREALMDNVRFINDEIQSKRKEFGLEY